MDFNTGLIPDAVKPEYLPNPDTSIMDYIDPFAGIVGPSRFHDVSAAGSGVDPIASAMSKFASSKASDTANAAPTTFDWDRTNADRFVQGSDYKELGFDPNADNETKYGRRQTWGDTIGQALAGGAGLASQTFIEGWKGWGNMADALFSWDSSKLVGSDEELLRLSKQQEDIMNKYAIYATPESEESLFSRQFFGNMLQQGGFALGAIAQFASEELLTMGLGTAFSATKAGANLARTAAVISRAERIRDLGRLGADIYKSEKIANGILNAAKKLVPLVNTAEDITKYSRAGAGAVQLASIGLGGIRRSLAEANMAFTEARMEAAGTYGDLYKKLEQEYLDTYKQAPVGADLDKIRTTARNAGSDNFFVNSGILMVSNRLQFDNLFSKFGPERRILKSIGQYGDDVLKVTGKAAGDATENLTTRVYNKSGILGAAGQYKNIAADFGTQTARWEVAKGLGRGIFKWEASEGIQELMQETSNTALQDYYYELYHGNKGANFIDSTKKAGKEQFSNQGLKTFLMGALTGRLLSPITFAGGKAVEAVRIDAATRSENDAARDEALDSLNGFYSSPATFLNETLATIKAQHKAGELMNVAVADRDKYTYNNMKDSSLAQLVAAAKKTDMLESVLDTIRDYSELLDAGQLKEAFNIDPTELNVENTRGFFNDVAKKIEDYEQNWETLQEKYGDIVIPDIYEVGTEDHLKASIAKRAVDDAIQILATNRYKAERAIERAVDIYNEVSSNKRVGSSASIAFKHLGSTEETAEQIKLLKRELSSYKQNPTPDAALKELIKTKEDQLSYLEDWKENSKSLFEPNNPDALDPGLKALRAYDNYLRSKNQESKINVEVFEEDIQDTYEALMDYIKLNEDNKAYIDAYNVLGNPKAFSKMATKMAEAIQAVAEKLKKEHEAEINKTANAVSEDTGLEDDVDITDDFGSQNPDIFAPKPNTPAPTTDPVRTPATQTLDEYLQEKYDNLKQGDFGDQMPGLDVWKATAAGGFTREYERKFGKQPVVTPTVTVDPTMPEIDLEGPEITDAELQAEADRVFGTKPLSKVTLGKYDLEVGDTINDEEITRITDKAVFFEKTEPQVYDDVLKMLNPLNGRNLVKKAVAPEVVSEPVEESTGVLQNGQIENPESIENTVNNQVIPERVNNSSMFRDSDKVIQGGSKINTRSDDYVYTKDPVNPMKRTGPNPTYNLLMATPYINVGTEVTIKAETDIADYTVNGVTFTAADYFDGNNNIREDKQDDFPVAIYAKGPDGKETKLGSLPTLQWLEKRKPNGDTMNVLEFLTDGNGVQSNNLVEQVQKLKDLRANLYNNHNKNSTFVLTAVVDNKSEGKLRLSENPGKLSERLHPDTKIGIIKGGTVTLNNDEQLNLPADQVISKFDYQGKEGWPVVLLNSPTGRTLVSYVNVPKLNKDYQDIIINSWKAFQTVNLDKTLPKTAEEYKIVQAIYEAYGTTLEDGEQIDFNVLRGYINDYVTFLSGERYDSLKEGKAQLSITPKGDLSIWHVDTKDIEKDSVFVGSVAELNQKEDDFRSKLSNVYHNVKLSSEAAVGINSTQPKSFLTIKNGKVGVTAPMTYNQYMMGVLETKVDKGTPVSKTPGAPFSYFANPVVTFDGIESTPASLESVAENPVPTENAKPASIFDAATAPEEEELDLTMSFGKTIFDAGNIDDLLSIKTDNNISTHINKLDINKDCK